MEDTEIVKPKKTYDWLKEYQYVKGQTGNPHGRPKGRTLKEFAREFLEALPDEQKAKFLAVLDPAIVWRMAEGNPTEDRNIKISVPVPILGGHTQAHLSDNKNPLPSKPNSSIAPHTDDKTIPAYATSEQEGHIMPENAQTTPSLGDIVQTLEEEILNDSDSEEAPPVSHV